MESLLLVASLVLAVLGLVGCCTLVGRPSVQIPSGGILRSKKPRAPSPDVAAADLAELVAGNSAFAFDLYQAIREEEGNLFFSPYSISLALAMTYAGARGDTEQQMADTLHYSLPQGRLHPAFNALDLELASRAEGVEGQDRGFRLNIANSIWGQTGYSFLPQFLDVLAENYGAGLRVLDFENEPEDSRVTINDWVSDETEAKI
ncbi:MAG: serpin family protein, partial [Anaerolineae bacterium]|nr:serpin family protein [Anaerolineae bacterium]NIN97106.1 serpin family protein [Anaerolineae bacterium]NIQ80070.1 serpin family protein [Anaerolineae bacterium]